MAFKKRYPNTILQALGLILLSLILCSPWMVLYQKVDFLRSISPMMMLTIVYVLLFAFIIGIAYLINRSRGRRLALNFKPNNLALIPLLVTIICTFQLGPSHVISTVIQDLFSTKGSTNPFDNIIESIGALLLGPIVEEVVFRGLILQGILTNYSSRKAIIASSILFGLVHWNFNVLGAFLIGLFFGWVYYRTKSLGLTILLHFMANLSALLGGYIEYINQGSTTIFTLYGYLYPVIALIACVYFYIYITKLYKRKEEFSRPTHRHYLSN